MNKTENTLHKNTVGDGTEQPEAGCTQYWVSPPSGYPDKTDERITRHQFDARGFAAEC